VCMRACVRADEDSTEGMLLRENCTSRRGHHYVEA
jgi:hypothetical protein